ncbi:hypothetical protein E4T56_gene19758 [Termitomyces sp. T112]|nr:hypothetical protein E4T56_gene19758 [Termitomyces sp. T112]
MQDAAIGRILQHASGADRNTIERIIRHFDRQPGLAGKQLVQIGQLRPATGHDDPAIDDIGGDFGRRVFQCRAHGRDDLAHRFRQSLDNLA